VTRVLFVCLGNICRSPTAEGVLRARASAAGLPMTVASAGTGAWHVGEAPDRRAQKEARKRGYDLSDQRAVQAIAQDFHDFDLIFAMDQSNLATLRRLRPDGAKAELSLFLDLLPEQPLRDVPDPYYEDGFDTVLDLIEDGCDTLIATLRAKEQGASKERHQKPAA
jgi:protein-tyrosine phosphatase